MVDFYKPRGQAIFQAERPRDVELEIHDVLALLGDFASLARANWTGRA